MSKSYFLLRMTGQEAHFPEPRVLRDDVKIGFPVQKVKEGVQQRLDAVVLLRESCEKAIKASGAHVCGLCSSAISHTKCRFRYGAFPRIEQQSDLFSSNQVPVLSIMVPFQPKNWKVGSVDGTCCLKGGFDSEAPKRGCIPGKKKKRAMWSALQHAKEATVGFARRHKKLVVATGVTAACVAGAYYAYNRMVQEAEKFTQQLQRQMAEHQRLQLSLASTTEESNATIQRFLPRLKSKLYALVDLESVVQELKTLDKTQKSKRNELWEHAKNLALTRYFTALIAFGLWHLLVFAQVSIIGKRVFEKSKVEKDLFAFGSREDEEKAHAAAHHAFLASGLEYFLDEGLQKIKAHVASAVATNEQLKAYVHVLICEMVIFVQSV